MSTRGRQVAPEDDTTRDVYLRAEEYKEKGNAAFMRGLYSEATEAYSKAIGAPSY